MAAVVSAAGEPPRPRVVQEGGAQLEMFAQTDEKRRKLAAVLDRLNLGGKTAAVSRGHQLGGKKEI